MLLKYSLKCKILFKSDTRNNVEFLDLGKILNINLRMEDDEFGMLVASIDFEYNKDIVDCALLTGLLQAEPIEFFMTHYGRVTPKFSIEIDTNRGKLLLEDCLVYNETIVTDKTISNNIINLTAICRSKFI